MSDITITTRIARVINDFLGEKIIPRHYIGKHFSQGTKYDGGTEIEALSGACLNRQIIRSNGKIFFSVYPQVCQENNSVDAATETGVGELDSEKAALVISALYGFTEARLAPSETQEAQVILLRKAMLPKSIFPELLKLPIVVLKESFASNLGNKE